MKQIFPWCCIVLAVAGCNLAPKYARPDFVLPESWRIDADSEEDLANGPWWDRFGDPALGNLIRTALENNNDMQIAVWRVSEYLAQYQVVKSALFPAITGNAGATKERFPLDADFFPAGTSPISPDFHMNLSLSYEIDFWGKIRNQTTAAYASYLGEIANRKTVVLTLIGSVAQGYIYLKQLALQHKTAMAIMEVHREGVRIAQDRFEGGLTSKIEVDQALSVYEQTVAVVRELEKRLSKQENLLSVLLGKPPGPIAEGISLNELTLPEEIPSCKPEELLVRRPDIVRAEQALIAANANIGVARAAFFPQLGLNGLFGTDNLSLNGLLARSARTWLLGGSVMQTVFAGGQLVNQLKISEIQKQKLLFAYEDSVLQALREVNDALVSFTKDQEIYRANAREVVALKDYLSLAWYRYYEGQTQYLTVLDAEREVLSAEMDMIAAQADQFLSLISVYKAVGGGWVTEADAALQQQTDDRFLVP